MSLTNEEVVFPILIFICIFYVIIIILTSYGREEKGYGMVKGFQVVWNTLKGEI